jgi:murein L,D-transpeptidase YcbB/YkuD
MLKGRDKRGGAIAAAAGFAAALFATGLVPANAGPFSWLTGKNQQQQQQQQQLQEQPQYQPPPQQAGRSGLFPFFGGGKANRQWQGAGPDPVTAPHASELPRDDPDASFIVNPPLGTPTLSTRNIEATKAAIERYKGIAQNGWQMVPRAVMKPGQRGQNVALLQQRLAASGDYVGPISGEYDAAVVAAVKTFQTRHGIGATGVIDTKAVIDALNVPPYMRLAQLQSSLRRLQSLAPNAAGRYVVVNIPAAQVEAVAGGEVELRQIAVVGKPQRPTPEISSKIQEINFNPYWYVPRTIIIQDLVPKGREFARRGQNMLAAYNMEAFDAAGNPLDPRQINWNSPEVYNYNFRQRPHGENSLGFVKINFPNKDSVYMHDTPLKGLFANNERFQSSGCVRVYNVDQVVAWILRGTPGWSYERIVSMKHTGEQMDVKLSKPVPVYLAYISAWGTPDGQVNFRPDIYGLDGASTTASAY